MNVLVGSLLLFSLFIPARADDLPDAPSTVNEHTAPAAVQLPSPTRSSDVAVPPNRRTGVVFPKKVYWPLVAACGTAAIFDAQMSYSYEVSHPTSSDSGAWLVGKRPSLGRYYATFAVLDGGTVLISYKLLHSRRKAVRIIGWGLLGGVTAIHTNDVVMQTQQ